MSHSFQKISSLNTCRYIVKFLQTMSGLRYRAHFDLGKYNDGATKEYWPEMSEWSATNENRNGLSEVGDHIFSSFHLIYYLLL